MTVFSFSGQLEFNDNVTFQLNKCKKKMSKKNLKEKATLF